MKILLRKYGTECYVWKKAKWKNFGFYVVDDNNDTNAVPLNNIVTIDKDSRKGKVVCRSCGALIKNTPEAIAKHYMDMESKKDCLKCQCLKVGTHLKEIKQSYTLQEDGTYNIASKFNANLYCGKSGYYYTRYPINSLNANDTCMYFECRRKGVIEPNDIFIKYPGVFDDMITTDALTEHKWKYEGVYAEHFVFDGRSRGTLKACVNSIGIVDKFELRYRGRKYYFYYSYKYDKLFRSDYGTMIPYEIPQSKITDAKKKIRALYEEVEK